MMWRGEWSKQLSTQVNEYDVGFAEEGVVRQDMAPKIHGGVVWQVATRLGGQGQVPLWGSGIGWPVLPLLLKRHQGTPPYRKTGREAWTVSA
jgi:hypothetical protein